MMRSKLLAAFAAGIMAVTVTAKTASAGVIDLATLVGTWDIQDQFSVLGNFYNNSYKASTATTAKFTDLFVWGDEYGVYVNNVQVTSALRPVASSNAFISDPDLAYNSGVFTRGTVALNAGDVLSFKAITLPPNFTDGTLAVTAVNTTAPEPSTWVMMVAGLGMVGVAARRRRTQVA